MKIILVVAISGPNRVMGKDNQLPWDIPEEMADFRAFTNGKTFLMGRKTFEGIGRILQNRRNIMLTRDPEKVRVGEFPVVQKDGKWIVDGGTKGIIEIYTSIQEVVNQLDPNEDLLVLGGVEIYKLFLDNPHSEIRLSEIHDTYEGDTFFPEFIHLYEEVSRENRGKYDLVWYRRKLIP